MENILERVGKKRECPSCSYTLKYSWLSLINKDWIALYSKAGDAVLVSPEVKKLFSSEDALAKGIPSYEKQRNFDKAYQFSVRNEMKCPSCGSALTSRCNESFEKIVNGRLVFLDGMTFINDDKKYRVQVIVN